MERMESPSKSDTLAATTETPEHVGLVVEAVLNMKGLAATTETPEHVGLVVEAVLNMKGLDVAALDLRGSTDVTDFFVICSAEASVHARAISEAAREALLSLDRKPWHIEGTEGLNWVLIDFVDIVVHIFREDARQFYGLEDIWADAPRLPIPNLPADG
jgi:ribosome-associated protein